MDRGCDVLTCCQRRGAISPIGEDIVEDEVTRSHTEIAGEGALVKVGICRNAVLEPLARIGVGFVHSDCIALDRGVEVGEQAEVQGPCITGNEEVVSRRGAG